MRGKLYEHDFNQGLAEAMTRCHADSRVCFYGERVGLLAGGRRADVLVTGPGLLPVAVEGEYSDPASNPDDDAEQKLGVKLVGSSDSIQAAVAVRYPQGASSWDAPEVEQRLLAGTRLEYAVRTLDPQARWPSLGWIKGDAKSLTDLAVTLTTPNQLVTKTAKDSAARLLNASEFAGGLLGSSARQALAVAVGRPTGLDSLRVAAVVWLNAFLFQDRIAGAHRLQTRADCRTASGQVVPNRVLQAWRAIQAVDYRSVYVPAIAALQILVNHVPNMEAGLLLTAISDAADNAEGTTLGLFDIGGELFQRVISDRDNAASYYTHPEVAEFLSRLVASTAGLSASLATTASAMGDTAPDEDPPPPPETLRPETLQRRCASATSRAAPARCCAPSTDACAPAPSPTTSLRRSLRVCTAA